MIMKKRLAARLLLLISCGLLWTAGAQARPSSVIYDPASGSYFQLFDDNTHPSTYPAAEKRAFSKFYKGVRGRLAEIHSRETHELITKSFENMKDPHVDVWIGLRYWCNVRMLQWGRNRPYSPSEPDQFRLWHNPWERNPQLSGGSCGRSQSRVLGYAPVYYRFMNNSIRWQSSGAGKGFRYYLVEFPVGEAAAKDEEAKKPKEETGEEPGTQ